MHDVLLRRFEDSDIDLLTEWLNKDYIQQWYHNPADWLCEIRERKSRFSWIHHFIVMAQQTPIGFCQYYDCFDAGELEDWYDVIVRGDTFSIDYLIGDAAYLGKGYGKAVVRALRYTLQQTAGAAARQIIVLPELENCASVGVLLANGYVFDAEKGYFFLSLL